MDPKTAEFIRLVGIAGWSQAETARRLEITPGAVSQIFSGTSRPRQALLNLLRLLVREPQKAIGGQSKASAGRKPRAIETDLLENFRRLTDSQQQLVLKLARELAASG